MLSDERAAFEAWCFANGLMAESHGVRSESRACDVAWLAWQASAEAAVKDAVGGEAVGKADSSAPGGMYWFFGPQLEDGTPLYTRPQASAAVPEGFVRILADLVEASAALLDDMRQRAINRGDYEEDGEPKRRFAVLDCGNSVLFGISNSIAAARDLLAASQPEVK